MFSETGTGSEAGMLSGSCVIVVYTTKQTYDYLSTVYTSDVQKSIQTK